VQHVLPAGQQTCRNSCSAPVARSLCMLHDELVNVAEPGSNINIVAPKRLGFQVLETIVLPSHQLFAHA
jgi:hypothetical protein